MAVRKIVVGDELVLRTPSEQVVSFDKGLSTLLDDLTDTMVAAGGIGLSAPQVGLPLRAAVVDVGNGPVELVNPVLLDESGSQTGVEACLSFPGVALQVTRPQRIVVAAADRTGEVHEWAAEDRLARVMLHEMDHLDGVLFFDRVPEEEMLMQLWDQMADMVDTDLQDSEDSEDNVSTQDNANPATESALSSTQVESDPDEPWLQDSQLAFDLMAEAAWKLELSLELLSDHARILTQADLATRLQGLSSLSQQLRESVDDLESCLGVTEP